MFRVKTFLQLHKTFFLSIAFLIVFSFTVSKAAPLYTPGETLDPQCVPGSTDCTVSTPSGGGLPADGTLLAADTNNSNTPWPDLGEGTRLMWYPSESAFRAGTIDVDGTSDWDSANVGQYSTAFGLNTLASGIGSFATGRVSEAIGDVSVAMGDGNVANGYASVAFGHHTQAVGSSSFTAGNGNVGDGDYSTAFGFANNAGGAASFVAGDGNSASGDDSMAFGSGNTASEFAATAFGNATTASGDRSTAFGYFNTASGAFSTAFGSQNTASGNGATAFGLNAEASGMFSTAFGEGTIASSYASTALGRFNLGGGSPTTWVGTDPLFEIGNGADDNNRSDAFLVLKNGDTTIGGGLTLPGGDIDVSGSAVFASGAVQFLDGGDATFGTATITLGSDGSAIFANGGLTIDSSGGISSSAGASFGSGAATIGSDGSAMFGSSALTIDTSGNLVTSGSGTFGSGTNAINSDGSVSFANGGFTIDSSGVIAGLGTVSLANGGLTLDGSGNLHVTGDVSCDGVCGIPLDGAILAYDRIGSNTAVPDLGAGTRLMWYPSKSAFRVGTVTGGYWDDINVGQDSTAFGLNTTASGMYATAFGTATIATGDASTAFGIFSEASGNYSIAFGSSSVASGAASTAFGQNATASGQFSTAFGYVTTASSYISTTFGRFNIDGGTDPVTWVSTDPLFEVGNGADPSNHSDALIILKNGNTGIGLDPTIGPYPTYLLQVGSSAQPAGVVSRFENTDGTCDVNPTAGSVVCSSDMNLKKNITLLADNSAWNFNTNVSASNQSVLSKILALSPVSYNWNAESNNAAKHPGFIAQDIKQVFPDLVYTDSSSGLLSLNYTGLIPYTVQAIKEMNLNITDISNLDRDNTWRNALIAWLGNASNGITNIFSKKITTDQLCVGTTCVTQQQFLQILQNSNNNNGGSTTVANPPVVPPADDTEPPVVDEEEPTTPPVEETVQDDTTTPVDSAPADTTEEPAAPIVPAEQE